MYRPQPLGPRCGKSPTYDLSYALKHQSPLPTKRSYNELDLDGQERSTMEKKVSFEEALERARRMSERYVERGPYRFFPLTDIVQEVQRGLAKNLVNHGHLYCP